MSISTPESVAIIVIAPNLQMRKKRGEASVLVTVLLAVVMTKATHRRRSSLGFIVPEA